MRFPTRFSPSDLLLCDCLRTLVSAVLAAMGLLREGFLVGGEAEEADGAEDWDAADRVGEVDFLMGTGIGRTTATGLTAVGD